jgi:hypothetical protein
MCQAFTWGSHVTRKLLSALFLLTAISVGLGAFGHGSQWSRHVAPALTGLDTHLLELLKLVWYWVSGAMFTLGALLVWAWWRMERGEMDLAFVPWMVGAFYLVEGVYGAVYLGIFFLLFVVQAVLLWGTTLALRRART